jgi:hypothetical protein
MKLTREFYIPKAFKKKIDVPNSSLVIYIISDTSAMGFSGKKAKQDFYYEFKSSERMKEFLAQWINKYFKRQKYNEELKAKKKAAIEEKAKSIKVGDIYYTSWGYDQTNIDFYKVLDVRGKKATLVKVGKNRVEGEKSYDFVVPAPDPEGSEPFNKMVGEYGFKIKEYAYATAWDGTPKIETALGWGH